MSDEKFQYWLSSFRKKFPEIALILEKNLPIESDSESREEQSIEIIEKTLHQLEKRFDAIEIAIATLSSELKNTNAHLFMALKGDVSEIPVAWGMRDKKGGIYDCHYYEYGDFVVPLYAQPIDKFPEQKDVLSKMQERIDNLDRLFKASVFSK